MESLLNAPIDEIIMIFNDEMNNMINQLMHIANHVGLKPEEMNTITFSKNKLINAIKINRILCIEMYAKFLLDDNFSDFYENIKNKQYDYFYGLSNNTAIDEEFRDLVILIKTISYNVDKETKENVFGYMENLSILATIFAKKKILKN